LPVALCRRSLGRRPRRQPASAAALVAGLAEAVPGFADVGDWQGRPVPLHRKAAGLAGDLAARFGGEDARFAFADAADLPADSGASCALHACSRGGATTTNPPSRRHPADTIGLAPACLMGGITQPPRWPLQHNRSVVPCGTPAWHTAV